MIRLMKIPERSLTTTIKSAIPGTTQIAMSRELDCVRFELTVRNSSFGEETIVLRIQEETLQRYAALNGSDRIFARRRLADYIVWHLNEYRSDRGYYSSCSKLASPEWTITPIVLAGALSNTGAVQYTQDFSQRLALFSTDGERKASEARHI
jgi:hypothetical protein